MSSVHSTRLSQSKNIKLSLRYLEVLRASLSTHQVFLTFKKISGGAVTMSIFQDAKTGNLVGAKLNEYVRSSPGILEA